MVPPFVSFVAFFGPLVGLALGVLSTTGYALGKDFLPLLGFRAMWGVAWTLIVVRSRTLIARRVLCERGR